MPTPCQKCFTIARAPIDCAGNVQNIAFAIWDIVRTQTGGSGTVVFTGGNGTFTLDIVGAFSVEEWTAQTYVCNPTDDPVVVSYQFEADITITGADGLGQIGCNSADPTGSAVTQHINPAGLFTIPAQSIGLIDFSFSVYADFGSTANLTGTCTLNQS